MSHGLTADEVHIPQHGLARRVAATGGAQPVAEVQDSWERASIDCGCEGWGKEFRI
jgi:hypothetical protein